MQIVLQKMLNTFAREQKHPLATQRRYVFGQIFVAQAKQELGETDIKIATVVNFPFGGTETQEVVAATEQAILNGANEIDLVFYLTMPFCLEILKASMICF